MTNNWLLELQNWLFLPSEMKPLKNIVFPKVFDTIDLILNLQKADQGFNYENSI